MIHLADSTHHAGYSLATNAESHTALLDIGTGDVQLDGRNLVQGLDLFGTGHVVVDGRTRDIDQYPRIILANFGVNMLDKIVHALVLQPHGIEHARRSFGHTGIGIALAGV